LQPRRGQDHHRSLAAVLQHREATLVAWIQATGTRGHHLACASKPSSTVICPGNSPKADHELRLKPDHPMGSGQSNSSMSPLKEPNLEGFFQRTNPFADRRLANAKGGGRMPEVQVLSDRDSLDKRNERDARTHK